MCEAVTKRLILGVVCSETQRRRASLQKTHQPAVGWQWHKARSDFDKKLQDANFVTKNT
jgi:hypothetical protein